MKLQHIPLDQIVPNPWRDTKLYPIDKDHVTELRQSIDDHGFFASVKGRRRDGKIELGCGHARIEAARRARLDTVPIFIDDMDDDAMLRLMTDENATQAGANPGAVMNEVAAVTRRLIDGLLGSTIVEPSIVKAFDGQKTLKEAIGKLRNGSNAHLVLGEPVVRRYLGQGHADRAHRGARQIREAIGALKQSGVYDDIIEQTLRKYPPPTNAKPSQSKELAPTKQSKPRQRILDERCANLFANDNQFHAFREAVTTPSAQQAIPVKEQYELAKQITAATHETKKHLGAPYIKGRVQQRVQEHLKQQRKIDKEERDRYFAEQINAEIDNVLYQAKASLRSLLSRLDKLIELAGKYPAHPKLGGFSAKLDELVAVIQEFSRKLK